MQELVSLSNTAGLASLLQKMPQHAILGRVADPHCPLACQVVQHSRQACQAALHTMKCGSGGGSWTGSSGGPKRSLGSASWTVTL